MARHPTFDRILIFDLEQRRQQLYAAVDREGEKREWMMNISLKTSRN